VVLLALDSKASRDEFENRLPQLKPIDDPVLGQAVIGGVTRRVASLWPIWLDSLAPDVADKDPVRAQLKELGTSLWEKANGDRSRPTDAELRAALTSLRRLGDASSDELQARVAEPLAGVAENEALAEAMRQTMSVAAAFADHGLVDFAPLADSMADAFATMLGLVIVSPPQDGSMVSLVRDWLPGVAQRTSTDQRVALQNALRACDWMGTPAKEATLLELAVASRAAGDDIASPIAVADLVALASAHPKTLEVPVSQWTEYLASASEAAELLAGLTGPIPGLIVSALEARAARGRAGAWEVAEKIIQRVPAAVPDAAVMRALRVGARDADRAAELLVARYEQAGNNAERERVLRSWSAISPRDSAARKTLIERVFTPTLQGSKGGLEAVLRHLDLVVDPPHGTAQNLRRDLVAAGEKFGHAKATRKAMEQAGLIKPRKKRFGLW
jgi:hypothetical protein